MQELKAVTQFPYEVECHETMWIPLSDGVHLAARVWLPQGAEQRPVPAILEYIPYRRRDLTRTRDAVMHPYFAGHGYASVRVDMRGSGDSEGVLPDEYTQQELDDGIEILRWLAEQPWCNGKVGMIGISWGGFNGLQMAAMQPPELGAVVAVCFSDDRYADDVHYMGGCLLGDNLSWASTMFAFNSLPPDPEVVGDDWRRLWHQRLENNEPWVIEWLRHQHRRDYWKHASVCEDYSKIQCPVMGVSGWADGYSNAVFRLMEKLDVPRQGLIGPWSHKYPHEGVPGPNIGFLQEVVRWWDHWLKGTDNGVDQEPVLRAWLQDSVPPFTHYQRRPGRWLAEPEWPSPHVQTQVWQLDSGDRLLPDGEQVDTDPLPIQSPLSVGLFAGKWCSYMATPDLPHDQREEDGGALIFESPTLEKPLELLGSPTLEVEVSSDQPVAMLAARLSDVAPDDKATRVTYGVLNLCHRDSHENPEELEPGKRYKVRLTLNGCAQQFPAGHRLRLSLSTSYFPLAWAPPKPARLTIYPGPSKFYLPLHQHHDSPKAPEFGEPEGAPPIEDQSLERPQNNWWVKRDLALDLSTLEVINDPGWEYLPEVDLEKKTATREWYSYCHDDFDSLRGETLCEWGFARGDWQVETVTRTVMTCDAENFYIHAQLDAWEGKTRVFSRNWNEAIPRNLV